MIPGISCGEVVCRMGGISERLYERPRSVDGGDSLNGGYEAMMDIVPFPFPFFIFYS